MEMDGDAVRELRNRSSFIKEHDIGKSNIDVFRP
jgi:hypothetical protein